MKILNVTTEHAFLLKSCAIPIVIVPEVKTKQDVIYQVGFRLIKIYLLIVIKKIVYNV